MMRKLLLCCLIWCLGLNVQAQVAKDQVIKINTTFNTGSTITLNWPQDTITGGEFRIFKRTDLNAGWSTTPFATVPGNQSSYVDNTMIAGMSAEYNVVRFNGVENDALGYIYVGNDAWSVPTYMGRLILVVDSNYRTPLSTEIERLTNDLNAEGWRVTTLHAGRNETPQAVKSRIAQTYNDLGSEVRSLLLLGHIPVPYSGNFSTNGDAPPPDGHVEGSGNHTGAWPADVYYADMDGNWTDATVTLTTGNQDRHHNVPGDGKFDHSKLPDSADLEMGRIDLYDMPLFGKSDTILVKEYLDRNHAWRTGQLTAIERGVIDNNFKAFNIASTGYHNFSTFLHPDSIHDDRDYFTSVKSGSYLWSYGCGAGSYTTCAGIGNSADYNNDSVQTTFTILAGSFFGDWDFRNNFLRAPLAQSTLASFWGGIPKWYIHHMGLGLPIGYGTKLTQNNVSFYFNGNFNFAHNSVHIALMGDPTLRMRHVAPPSNFTATASSGDILLQWAAANGAVDGYNVYRYNPQDWSFTRLNTNIITGTNFTDEFSDTTGLYQYAVRAVRREVTASGSFYNLSGGETASINHVNSVGDRFQATTALKVYPNPSSGHFTVDISTIGTSSLQWSVMDLTGKVVFSENISAMNQSELLLNLSTQTPGMYLLQVHTARGTFSQKLIKAPQ